MTPKQFSILLEGWRSQTLTREQAKEFVAAVNSLEFDQLIDDTLEGHLDAGDLRDMVVVQHTETSLNGLLKKIAVNDSPEYIETQPRPIIHRIHFLRTAWFRYAAAVLIILAGFFIYEYFFPVSSTEVQTVKVDRAPTDILPGSNKAILTLSDGSKVELNSAASETIKDGTLSIENNNGQLIYEKGKSESVALNTMSTPRGGQYQLVLPDGSKVWLNAESSITFPVSFTGATREVKITGEAYFEIRLNKEKPFIVKAGNENITVLGTSFNVNAYPDEKTVKTSLIEGSVKVADKILKPGQAHINNKIVQTDINQDIAWKNGAFDFNNFTMIEAARQIGRWYDIEIRFDGPVPQGEIYGGVSRTVTLQRLLKGMEGEFAHFTLKGKVLYIKAL